MVCIGLERFFELPIIPAPKRNSKLHCEMGTNPFLLGACSAHGHECAALHEALTSDTPVSSLGARPRAWEPEIAFWGQTKVNSLFRSTSRSHWKLGLTPRTPRPPV